jgi:hypothetical protein
MELDICSQFSCNVLFDVLIEEIVEASSSSSQLIVLRLFYAAIKRFRHSNFFSDINKIFVYYAHQFDQLTKDFQYTEQ